MTAVMMGVTCRNFLEPMDRGVCPWNLEWRTGPHGRVPRIYYFPGAMDCLRFPFSVYTTFDGQLRLITFVFATLCVVTSVRGFI